MNNYTHTHTHQSRLSHMGTCARTHTHTHTHTHNQQQHTHSENTCFLQGQCYCLQKTTMLRQLEGSLSSRESSLQSSVRDWQSRAETAEKEVRQLFFLSFLCFHLLTFLKHITTIVTMPICFLVNVLKPRLQHSKGWQVHTVCVQVLCVPTLSTFMFSCQIPKKDHNELLSTCLLHLTQFCMNVKRDFIG